MLRLDAGGCGVDDVKGDAFGLAHIVALGFSGTPPNAVGLVVEPPLQAFRLERAGSTDGLCILDNRTVARLREEDFRASALAGSIGVVGRGAERLGKGCGHFILISRRCRK